MERSPRRMRGKTSAAVTAPAEPPADLDAAFRAHERSLRGLCYRMTGVAADAEEIVQEAFARALERRDREAPIGPWLVRVATNLCLDLLRTRRRRGYSGSWLPSPVGAGELDDAGDAGDAPGARYERL